MERGAPLDDVHGTMSPVSKQAKKMQCIPLTKQTQRKREEEREAAKFVMVQELIADQQH
jgi:hypothetical protein